MSPAAQRGLSPTAQRTASPEGYFGSYYKDRRASGDGGSVGGVRANTGERRIERRKSHGSLSTSSSISSFGSMRSAKINVRPMKA